MLSLELSRLFEFGLQHFVMMTVSGGVFLDPPLPTSFHMRCLAVEALKQDTATAKHEELYEYGITHKKERQQYLYVTRKKHFQSSRIRQWLAPQLTRCIQSTSRWLHRTT